MIKIGTDFNTISKLIRGFGDRFEIERKRTLFSHSLLGIGIVKGVLLK
jgi:hypothetical protein